MPKKQFSIWWLLVATMLVALLIAFGLYIFSPPSTAVSGNPKFIVDGLLPPISKGDHYMKPAPTPTQSVWLFGAYNNGRKEENVLVENNGQSVRYRSYWLNSDGKLWCIDIALTNADWNALISKLQNERVDKLPNLIPDVSHAMTYWLKLDNSTAEHEACVYGIELMDTYPLFRGDQKYANSWKTIIDCLLQIREDYPDEIRSTNFLPNGSVDWESSQKTNAGLTEILNW